MINFDALTLKIFIKENEDMLLDSKIQKIQQPSRNELIFFIRKEGITKKLYINFNPNFYHICSLIQES